MARLYAADENFPFPVVEELRHLGHDVLTLVDAGIAGQRVTDEALLKLATADARAVLTLNRRDFIQLHEQTPTHGGIVVCTFDRDFAAQAARIDTSLKGPLNGQLIRVNRPQS